MAQLPGGYVDTGIVRSFTWSGRVEIHQSSDNDFFFRPSISTSGWRLFSALFAEGVPPFGLYYRLNLQPPTGPVVTLSSTVIPSGVFNDIPDAFYPPQNWAITVGPFRLGMLLYASGSASEPYHIEDYTLSYRWFKDAATVSNESFAGVTRTRYPANNYSAAPPSPSATPIMLTIDEPFGFLDWSLAAKATFGSGKPYATGKPLVKVRTMAIDWTTATALMDTRSLASPAYGIADGDFDGEVASGAQTMSEQVYAPTRVTYDLDVRTFDGIGQPPALVHDNWLTVQEMYLGAPKDPYAANVALGMSTYTVQNAFRARPERNGPFLLKLDLDSTWPASQGWDPLDLHVNCDQPSLRAGADTYTPVTVSHAASVQLDRPDGGRPSSWTSSDTAQGTVSENASDTEFVVISPSVSYTRTLRTNWRNYLDNTKPDFQSIGWSILKHNFVGAGQTVYPEDVWWWNSYSFLKLNATASAGATLTLTVTGKRLGVPFANNSAPPPHQYTEVRQYNVLLAAGTADAWIDLAFPSSFASVSGATLPMPVPRVDTLQVRFSAAGTFRLNSMALARRDTYPNLLKIAYTPISTYETHNAVYLEVDGSANPVLEFPPGEGSSDLERTPGFGGAIPYTQFSPVVHRTAQAMWADVNRLEGLSTLWHAAASDAFIKDSFGVALAPELAGWAVEQTPGTPFTDSILPPHAIRVGQVEVVPGYPILVRGRKRLGGAVESVVTANGRRAAAGIAFELVDQSNNVLGASVTDDRGRIHVEPIGHGKTVQFQQI